MRAAIVFTLCLVGANAEWKQMRPEKTRMCANGRWFPSAYARKPANGKAQGAKSAGGALTPAEAMGSIGYCVQAMAKDKSCSKEFVGVARNNGHCWCVKAGDKCTKVEDKEHGWQFQMIDYSDYIGLRIKKEKSIVSFGPKADVKLVRAGPQQLKVVADRVHLPANINIGQMSIEAMIVKTVMDKIKPHIALCQPGWDGPWCAKNCAKKSNQYFTSGFKTEKNCAVATCPAVASCAAGSVTCKSATTSQCGKCNKGYILTNGVKDKCTKCPTGYSCDGSTTKTLAGSSTLVDLGGSGHTKGKLAKCQGDCDSDSHCQSGLKCYQRDKSTQGVPGCKKGGKGDIGTHDYCYNPTPLQNLGSSAHTKGKLDVCQGDCDSDSHCKAGLKCFQRSKSSEKVPGCPAGGKGDQGSYDYCYQPCATGYFLTTGKTDTCTKCPTGYSCDGTPTKKLAGSSTLMDLGGSAHTKGKLARCQGDCDSDSHCQSGLKCYQRDRSSQRVPGCRKGGKGDIGTHDYCYNPTPLENLGSSAHTKGKLDVCQGDCDNDSHCKAGLKCFQRSKSSEKVPGCPAGGKGDQGSYDYCYQPIDFSVNDFCKDYGGKKLSSGDYNNRMLHGMQLVRRVARGTKWHPTNDDLRGSAKYGTKPTNPTSGPTGTWQWSFSKVQYYMFSTGDFSEWMIMKRSILNSKFGGPKGQQILCSSDYSTPKTYNQYFRNGCCNEDPWLSYKHHGTSTMMYGENGYNGHSENVLKNGMNVWIYPPQ